MSPHKIAVLGALLLSGAALAESDDIPAKVPEKSAALAQLENIHQTLFVLAKRRVQAEAGGSPAQRAFLLDRLDRMRVVVEDNALCGDEGFPVHYSEINNQLLVCPRTAEAGKSEQVRALARGLALSLSPCHAGAWLLKPGIVEKLESGDAAPLAACTDNEADRHALVAVLLQSTHAGQTAFPLTLEWAKALQECRLLEPSPYHPLDGQEKFFAVPFGQEVEAAVDTLGATAILERLLELKDRHATTWDWPACQEEALEAFTRQLAEDLLK